MRAGRVRVLRERLPELRAETLLVFLCAECEECEECASAGQPPGSFLEKEKKTTEGTHPTRGPDETRVHSGRTSDPRDVA